MKNRCVCCILSLLLMALLASCGTTDTASPNVQVSAAPSSVPVSTPSTPVPTPEPTPTPAPAITQVQLEQAMAQAGSQYGAMGIQAAVIQDGTVTMEAAWGWAVKDTTALTPQHKLRCASLTKVAVGLSAALLLDQQVIDPEADISQYWGSTVCNPYYPDTPITVNTLITHTSSLSDTSSLSALKGSSARQRLAGSGFQAIRPGDPAGWSYNNYGFAVLGMTLELAADAPLDQVLGEGMLEPMGIDAAFEAGSVSHTELLAPLYQGGYISRSVSEMLGYVCNPTPGYRGNFFAGGFTCSAGDYARLIAVLVNDGLYEGQALLSPEAVTYLETPLEEAITDEERGITFQQCRPLRYQAGMYGREGLYYHTGSAYGFYGLLSYDPLTGDGVVVFTTGASGALDEYGVYAVCGAIAQAVYAPPS